VPLSLDDGDKEGVPGPDEGADEDSYEAARGEVDDIRGAEEGSLLPDRSRARGRNVIGVAVATDELAAAV